MSSTGNRTAIRIDTRTELKYFARTLGVRPDWHEPDEQDVRAVVHGTDLDNAGFWGHSNGTLETYGDGRQELWIELWHEDTPVAEINLATLLAWAAGLED